MPFCQSNSFSHQSDCESFSLLNICKEGPKEKRLSAEERLYFWIIFQKEFGEDLVLSLSNTGRMLNEMSSPFPKQVTIGQSAVPPVIAHSSPFCSLNDVTTLDDLKKALFNFDGCALKKTAHSTVFGDGDPSSPLMLVGEGPGADEDEQGLPFVGRSGQLLNKMLGAIGIKRESVYITNVVNWRPPGNRTPTPEEIAQCLPFLKKHIELIHPQFIVLLGATAMRAVLNWHDGLSRARGLWHTSPLYKQAKIMVTFHPSYLLRSPGQKKFAWEDLQRLQAELMQHDDIVKALKLSGAKGVG